MIWYGRYANVNRSSITYVADQLDCLLVCHKSQSQQSPQKGTGEEESVAVLRVFEALTKDMRRLTDLPLAIHSVQGISPAFRETEVRLALLCDCKDDCYALRIFDVLQVFPPIPCTVVRHGIRLGEKGSPLGKVMVPAQTREKELAPWTSPLRGVGNLFDCFYCSWTNPVCMLSVS